MAEYFTLKVDGRDLSDFKAYVFNTNWEDGAERDIETIIVPGRSKPLNIDKGSWKPFSLYFDIFIASDFLSNFRSLRSFLNTKSDTLYKLEYSGDTETFLLGRFLGDVSVNKSDRQGGYFRLEFECDARRYFFSGEEELEYTGSKTYTLYNNTDYEWFPLIKMTGDSSSFYNVGKTQLQVTGSEGREIAFDTDTENIYFTDDNSNANACVTLRASGSGLTLPTISIPPGKIFIWAGGTGTTLKVKLRGYTI